VSRPEVLAFLTDIKAHRSDPTPRLVLADWLEERDDPRGTLLRTQWELRSADLSPSRRLELVEQERSLIQRHQERWLGPLRGWVDSSAFQRGLVQLQSSPDRLVRARAPELIDSEELAWVETIRLYGATATGDDYAGSRSLQGACVLDCSWARLGFEQLSGLSRAEPFPYLSELILNTCDVCESIPEGLGPLGTSESFPALVELHLAGCELVDTNLTFFAGSSLFRRLHLLDLRNNRIGRLGVEAIAMALRAGSWQMRQLNLMHNQLTDDALPGLLSSALVNSLHGLDLHGNNFTPAAQQRLREHFGPRLRLGN
jgi:uncharacterized protein (TIGR02996 family)